MKSLNTHMDPTQPAVISDDELHALLDARLSPAEQDALQARLRVNPAAAATLAAMQAQRDALRGLHAQVLQEPVPPGMLRVARQASAARQQVDQWWRLGGLAASVVLAFGVGWWSHDHLDERLASGAGDMSAAKRLAQAGQQFVRQASVAHAVYAPEARHPVEVTSAQQEHLLQWLSKRLGRPLKLPQLNAAGYELLGGRLLPGDGGARAQFMFQNAGGERVTLYLGALAGAPMAANAQETAFRFSSEGPVNSFYWMDRGFGYALAGQMPHDDLMKLAQLVYQQL
jgi:anti-sigma factor RsiW